MKTLPVKNSQFKMNPGSVNDRYLVFDLESDGLYDKVTKIHCIVIYDITANQTFSYGPDRITDAIAHLATADVLIGHNLFCKSCIHLTAKHASLTHSSAHD